MVGSWSGRVGSVGPDRVGSVGRGRPGKLRLAAAVAVNPIQSLEATSNLLCFAVLWGVRGRGRVVVGSWSDLFCYLFCYRHPLTVGHQ